MNSTRCGSSSSSRKRSLVVTCSAPRIGSGTGSAPLAITRWRACRRSPPTSIASSATKCAVPLYVAMPPSAKAFSLFAGTGSVKLRLKRIRLGQSIRRPGSAMPLPCRSRAASTTSAPRRSTFLGSHPRSWHVPPYGSSSTIATDQPAARQRFATVLAAAPVPTTTRAKVLSITVSQKGVVSRRGSRRLPSELQEGLQFQRLQDVVDPLGIDLVGERHGRVVVDLGALLLDETQVRAVVLRHFE